MAADEIKYHGDRAMAEIELAVRAVSPQAARSHLSLCALHLERLRRLARREPAPSAPVLAR
jgi:hypothetical protein